MRSIDPSTIPAAESHRYLLAGVAPRPIAFVGSNDRDGRVNLSPFSFFNAFGANPPVIAFSPAFRGTDGTPKHTFLNIKETGEFTVSVVSYSMIEQMNLASAEWPAGVDEFEKAGFSHLSSRKIKPPGVAESPMVMECVLLDHIDLGGKPASGNLMIGEVVMFHIKESAFEGHYPQYERLDLVARMGGNYYCRASGDAVFSLPKPDGLGVGMEAVPAALRTSPLLSGNHLGKLAGYAALPTNEELKAFWKGIDDVDGAPMPDDFGMELRGDDPIRLLRAYRAQKLHDPDSPATSYLHHATIAYLLDHGDTLSAWCCAMG